MTIEKSVGTARRRRPTEVVEVPREADLETTGGVTAVTRALQLLDTFGMQDERLSLAELTRRTGMHKTTILRLLRTLALAGYVVQRDDGEWRLGPAAGWLGARYQASFDANNVVEPMLLALSQATGESAAFYVREGNSRTCLARVEGPQPIRHHARMGAMLPLELGSPGRVILAFSGEQGKLYEDIRKKGYHFSIGEREKNVATVSAPVFGLRWALLGSVCISGPADRLPKAKLIGHAKTIMKAANELSYALAGRPTAQTPAVVSTWHP